MFGNKYIVGCIEFFRDHVGGDDIFVIILEYCDGNISSTILVGGTLADFIKKYGGKKKHVKDF